MARMAIRLGLRRSRSEPEPNRSSELLISESVEEGLSHVLGESGLSLVRSLFPKGKLPTDPSAFDSVLESVFMADGAIIIEREIAKRLLEKAGADYRGGRTFRSWLAVLSSHSSHSKGVTAGEKKKLRRFAAMAAVPSSHSETTPLGAKKGPASLEVTSLRFADAFQKGS